MKARRMWQAIVRVVARSREGVGHPGIDKPGFYLACGWAARNVEPDADEQECTFCGKSEVYGAKKLLLYIA